MGASESKSQVGRRPSQGTTKKTERRRATQTQITRHIIDLVDIYDELLKKDRNYAYESVKDFIEQHHEDINYCNEEGKTALMIARERGHQDLVSLLLQYGAFAETLDYIGKYMLVLTTSQSGEDILLLTRVEGRRSSVTIKNKVLKDDNDGGSYEMQVKVGAARAYYARKLQEIVLPEGSQKLIIKSLSGFNSRALYLRSDGSTGRELTLLEEPTDGNCRPVSVFLRMDEIYSLYEGDSIPVKQAAVELEAIDDLQVLGDESVAGYQPDGEDDSTSHHHHAYETPDMYANENLHSSSLPKPTPLTQEEEAAAELANEIEETNNARVRWLNEKKEIEEIMAENRRNDTPMTRELTQRIARVEREKIEWIEKAQRVQDLMGQQVETTPENVLMRLKMNELLHNARSEWLNKEKKVGDIVSYYNQLYVPVNPAVKTAGVPKGAAGLVTNSPFRSSMLQQKPPLARSSSLKVILGSTC